MREHQITINLRPDQFQEIQRLSRAAGSRSIGLFAREKLLTALGLSRASAAARAANPDLKSAAGDIRRLHRELQTFIAESLSTKDYAYVAAPPGTEPGMLLSTIDEESMTMPLSSGESGEDFADESADESADPLIQEQAQSADDLEELAERAFAISPRLGAIDELSDDEIPFSDPLDELLGDMMATEQALEKEESTTAIVETAQPEEIEEWDEESWPLEEESEQAAQQTTEDLSQKDDEGTEGGTAEATDEAEPKSHESAKAETEEKSTSDHQAPVQSDTESDDPPPGPPAPPTNLPLPPPLSGGPPPRKRRT